jgi:hypothetical protein
MRNRIVYVEAILRNQLLTSTSLMLLTGTGAIGCWKLPPIDLQNDSGAIGSAHQMINADSRADAKSTGAMSLDGQASPITEQTVTAIADASIGARATESAEAGADVVVAQVDAGANAGSIASTDASSTQGIEASSNADSAVAVVDTDRSGVDASVSTGPKNTGGNGGVTQRPCSDFICWWNGTPPPGDGAPPDRAPPSGNRPPPDRR